MQFVTFAVMQWILLRDKKKNKEITEDELRGLEKDIQNLTDKSVEKIDKLTKDKETELLDV